MYTMFSWVVILSGILCTLKP